MIHGSTQYHQHKNVQKIKNVWNWKNKRERERVALTNSILALKTSYKTMKGSFYRWEGRKSVGGCLIGRRGMLERGRYAETTILRSWRRWCGYGTCLKVKHWRTVLMVRKVQGKVSLFNGQCIPCLCFLYARSWPHPAGACRTSTALLDGYKLTIRPLMYAHSSTHSFQRTRTGM